jgi:biopolymer transport protein ExbD
MSRRNYQQLAVALLLSALTVKAQIPKVNLARGFESATVDPQLTNQSAILVSITADEQVYIGSELVAESDLSNRIARALTEHTSGPNKLIYIAIDRAAIYKVVVRVLNIIREQGIGRSITIALAVQASCASTPSHMASTLIHLD